MSTQLKIQTAVARLLDRYREVYPSGPHTRSQARDWDVALVAAIAKAVDIGISEHLKAEHEHLKADHTNEVHVHNPGTNFTGFVVGPKDGTIFTNCAPEPKMEGATVEGATVVGSWKPKVSPSYRVNPAARTWNGSYTHQVVSEARPLCMASAKLGAALNLLVDYWHTQHEVYEQRNEARKHNAALRSENHDMAETIKTMQRDLGDARQMAENMQKDLSDARHIAAIRREDLRANMDRIVRMRRALSAYTNVNASEFDAAYNVSRERGDFS